VPVVLVGGTQFYVPVVLVGGTQIMLQDPLSKSLLQITLQKTNYMPI